MLLLLSVEEGIVLDERNFKKTKRWPITTISWCICYYWFSKVNYSTIKYQLNRETVSRKIINGIKLTVYSSCYTSAVNWARIVMMLHNEIPVFVEPSVLNCVSKTCRTAEWLLTLISPGKETPRNPPPSPKNYPVQWIVTRPCSMQLLPSNYTTYSVVKTYSHPREDGYILASNTILPDRFTSTRIRCDWQFLDPSHILLIFLNINVVPHLWLYIYIYVLLFD